jgi:hypothetical protein
VPAALNDFVARVVLDVIQLVLHEQVLRAHLVAADQQSLWRTQMSKTVIEMHSSEARQLIPRPRLAHSIILPFLWSCNSQHRQFSFEDGNSMFLWNVGIYRRVYTASKPRRTSTSWNVVKQTAVIAFSATLKTRQVEVC